MSTAPEVVLPLMPSWSVSELSSGAVLHEAWLRPMISKRSVLGLTVLVATSGTVVASIESADARIDEVRLPSATLEAGKRWALHRAGEILAETHRLLQHLGDRT